jgi:imidazolonepropionase-like amidohydrolase
MKIKYGTMSGLCALLLAVQVGSAGAQDAAPQTLFTNVHVFDGVNEARIENANVLIEGNLIQTISTDPIETDGATVIDGGGRTLMPGLIDTHTHLSIVTAPLAAILSSDPSYITVRSVRDAEEMLMRGVTTVRDMGGNIFGLKRAIDENVVPGPRVYPAGRFITQTSGHFDFRRPNDTNRTFSGIEPTARPAGIRVHG